LRKRKARYDKDVEEIEKNRQKLFGKKSKSEILSHKASEMQVDTQSGADLFENLEIKRLNVENFELKRRHEKEIQTFKERINELQQRIEELQERIVRTEKLYDTEKEMFRVGLQEERGNYER
jgi:hypothetical protein